MVKLYIREYKYAVTMVTLAIASSNSNVGVFRWLYTHYNFDAPLIAEKYARYMTHRAVTVEDAKFCAGFASNTYTITTNEDPEVAISFLLDRPEELKKFIRRCAFSPELDRACAKRGITLPPLITFFQYVRTYKQLTELLRKWPHLVRDSEAANKIAQIAMRGKYADFARICAEIAAIPGIGDISDVVAAVRKEMHFVGMI